MNSAHHASSSVGESVATATPPSASHRASSTSSLVLRSGSKVPASPVLLQQPLGSPAVVKLDASSGGNRLGMLNGVFVPVMLNIVGVILFLRIGWAVAQAGWMGTLLMFVVGESMTLLTVLSLGALVSDAHGGAVEGGGVYFLISRSLGPEVGGAIGLLFYLAYAVGASFYVLGLATELHVTFFHDASHTDHDHHGDNEEGSEILVALMASAALLLILGVSVSGADAFSRVNGALFALQFTAILLATLCVLLPLGSAPEESGLIGPNADTFWDNAWPSFGHDSKCGTESVAGEGTVSAVEQEKRDGGGEGELCSFSAVFAIIFPAMTGIMEGANLSGDLDDPVRSIPQGTLAAVAASCGTYVVVVLALGASFSRTSLSEHMTPLQDASSNVIPGLVLGGILISALSSALGAVFGGARVLQALARDKLLPIPRGFGRVVGRTLTWAAPSSAFFAGIAQTDFEAKLASSSTASGGNEPVNAVLMTWVIAQLAVCTGGLDVVAPVISSFFCVSYSITNFACLHMGLSNVALRAASERNKGILADDRKNVYVECRDAEVTSDSIKDDGRPFSAAPPIAEVPSFKHWSLLSAGIGAILNALMMVALDPLNAALALALFVLAYRLIYERSRSGAAAPPPWVEVSDSRHRLVTGFLSRGARSYLQRNRRMVILGFATGLLVSGSLAVIWIWMPRGGS